MYFKCFALLLLTKNTIEKTWKLKIPDHSLFENFFKSFTHYDFKISEVISMVKVCGIPTLV